MMSKGGRHPQYNLRIPEEVRAILKQKAEENRLSLNQEIIARLEETIRQDEFLADSNEWVNNRNATYDDLLALYEEAVAEAEEWKEKDYSLASVMEGFEAVEEVRDRLTVIEKKLDK